MRSVVRCSMGLVALAAAALSYQSLAHLGALAGYGSLSILYPLVVDAGAAASCAAWLHTRDRQALAMTWSLLAVSVLLNATEHYLENTRTAPSWLLVVAVAAVPPSVLGLTVHLSVDLRRPDQRIPEEALAGSTAPRWREGLASDTQGNGSETPTGPDMARPDQRVEVAEPLTGSITSARIATLDVTSTNATPAVSDVTAHTSDSLNRGDQPGRPRGIDEPAELATPGVWGSALDDTHPGNRLDGLIAAGAGRRKIAAELGVTEHRAKQLIAASRNGHGR